MTLRCLVVDDEPLARKVLEKYIGRVPSLSLAGQCGNALEAAAFLHEHDVDLLFLDIRMPEMTGMEFLATLEHPPAVIVTTAHAEFAVEGFERDVVDYLLKPIPFERFLKAVNKATHGREPAPEPATPPLGEEFFVRVGRVDHRLFLSEIECFESFRNTVKIHAGGRTLSAQLTLASIEENLPRDRFVRIHKSYIVALAKIRKIEGYRVHLDSRVVPLGKYYKKDLERLVAARRIDGS
ncbi:MAG: response regulator transcription factor [Planctomycetota bacterium]